MGHHRLPGNPPVDLTLRRSPRARRISLRVSGLDGQVTLTLPRGVSEREALKFAHSKGDWLRAQLENQVSAVPVSWGAVIPVEGQSLRIMPGTGRRILAQGDDLLVPGPETSVGTRLQAFLKTLARDRLAVASDRYAAAVGRDYTRITLRDTRSRWGSCTTAGGLMYSWRLIMAPVEVLEYVAAHEVAHLQEMNHSAAFWSLVEEICPEYRDPRQWLRKNGAELHRYRFED